MERKELDNYIKNMKCIPGGTKEACIKVREVLKHKEIYANMLLARESSVRMEEFVEAVETLLLFAAKTPDEKVHGYWCEVDCVNSLNPNCKGRLIAGIDLQSHARWPEECPYYIEEDK